MAVPITVASETIDDPLRVLTEYAERYGRTLDRYDHAKASDPHQITSVDAAASRAIASRLSHAEARDVIARSARVRQLFTAVPVDAALADADPARPGGLYDDMNALFDAHIGNGVKVGKVSKLLHLKRPALYPILDSALSALYRGAATAAATRYPNRAFRRMHWAAIRDDVVANRQALDAIRTQAGAVPVLRARGVHTLSDVRLLDILAWKAQGARS